MIREKWFFPILATLMMGAFYYDYGHIPTSVMMVAVLLVFAGES